MPQQEHRPAFHAHSGWTFQRLPFGHVSVAPNSAAQAVSFTPETWASIVASLGKGGETNANWRAALAFHQDAHNHGEPTHIRAARDQVLTAVDAWEEARLACDKALINQHPGLAEGVAVMRAAVECYDAEERLLSLRVILAGLEAKDAARRQATADARERAAEQAHEAQQSPEHVRAALLRHQETAGQGDPGDEQPRSGGDTSPAPAHSPAQMLGSAVTATNAIDALRAAPAAYVPPPGTTHTLASVSGIAPAALTQLGVYQASGPTISELQGWFTRHGDLAMRYARFEDAWYLTFEHSIPTQQCQASAGYLLNALVALANAVLQQAGYTGKLSERL